jgi:hypothetical protein
MSERQASLDRKYFFSIPSFRHRVGQLNKRDEEEWREAIGTGEIGQMEFDFIRAAKGMTRSERMALGGEFRRRGDVNLSTITHPWDKANAINARSKALIFSMEDEALERLSSLIPEPDS